MGSFARRDHSRKIEQRLNASSEGLTSLCNIATSLAKPLISRPLAAGRLRSCSSSRYRQPAELLRHDRQILRRVASGDRFDQGDTAGHNGFIDIVDAFVSETKDR